VIILALLLAAALPDPPPDPPWACGKRLPRADFPAARETDSGLDAYHSLESPRGLRALSYLNTAKPGDPDLLGRTLPPFVTRERALAWTEHPRPDTVNLVAARRWESDRWVVVVAGQSPQASASGDPLPDFRLAVVEVAGANGPVRRLARTVEPLAPQPNWELLPKALAPVDDDPDLLYRIQPVALDFAPYRLSPKDRAFGVVFAIDEGWASGLGYLEALSLFRIKGESLIPILDVPVGVVKVEPGNWNKEEGTRQHDVIEADLLLAVRPRAGMADLVLRARGGRRSMVFRWDAAREAYGCRP
jgi:hypothetical protein